MGNVLIQLPSMLVSVSIIIANGKWPWFRHYSCVWANNTKIHFIVVIWIWSISKYGHMTLIACQIFTFSSSKIQKKHLLWRNPCNSQTINHTITPPLKLWNETKRDSFDLLWQIAHQTTGNICYDGDVNWVFRFPHFQLHFHSFIDAVT